MIRLVFLHTSPVHIATFDRLANEIAPTIPIQHVVNESLLEQACQMGITPALQQQVYEQLDAVTNGARMVLCTCSTIGGIVETFDDQFPAKLIRIDRPLAEHALQLGNRIVVTAAVESTLEPTRRLFEEVATQHSPKAELIDAPCTEAWQYFEVGDLPAYYQAIANHLYEIQTLGDVIVLAQASMAPAVELVSEVLVPILSSPRIGMQEAVRVYQGLSD